MTQEQQKRAELIRENLNNAGHIGKLDQNLIEVAACLSVEVEDLQTIVNANGFTFEDARGNIRPRPEVKMLQESRSKLVVALKELGMTPAARKRIEVDVQIDDPLEELRDGMD
jgi:P27 family predicted phage terminase small subunit